MWALAPRQKQKPVAESGAGAGAEDDVGSGVVGAEVTVGFGGGRAEDDLGSDAKAETRYDGIRCGL